MKVLLRQDFPTLGEAGKIVTVKDGYARNFLIPRGIAFEATAGNLKYLAEEKKRGAALRLREKKAAEALKAKMDGVSITAAMPVGEDDRIFGSVTNQDIADLLAAKGYEVDKRKISLDEPIRALGIYEIPIKLHAEVECRIKLWVVKQ
ncbi:MAG: 50S ribosomal protein L9 [bacterium]|nr:50S ribosomal protein L9 [bacterium]MCK6562805.1 50S ribosomal protein L9 [bacterium]NUM64601.1 50S ribosomal protein L9 [candidate division KSB1 bacterium]